MKRSYVAVILAVGLGLLPAAAAAETVLMSAPLKAGAGGLVCSCINLTDAPILVDFMIRTFGVSSNCGSVNVTPGNANACTASAQSVRTCVVSRVDGKSTSASQLVCNLAAVDAAGNPVFVVPVDKKFNQ